MPQIILDEGDVGHCSICPLVFSPKCLVTCQLCGQILENAERVSHHLELAHHGNSWMEVGVQKQDKLKCDLCLDLFFSRPLLEEHVIVAHLKEATVKIKNSQCYCNFCGKDFKNVQILMKHEQKCEARIKIVPDLMLGLSNKKTTLAKDVVMTCNKDEEVEEDGVSQDDFRYDDEDDDPMEDFEEMDLKKQEDLESNVNQDDFHYNDDDDPMEDFAEIDLEKQENPKSNVEEAIRKLDNTSVTFEMILLPKKEVQLEDVIVQPTVQDPEIVSYSNCCPHCPVKFKSAFKTHDHIVKEHYEEQLNELQVCRECKYKALDESFMFKHFSAKHKQNIVKYPNLICKLCSLFFKEESNLTNHKVEKHKGLHHIESYKEVDLKQLNELKERSEEAKNVKDEDNSKETKNENYHILDILADTCKLCKKSFKKSSALKRHMINIHPTVVKLFSCAQCNAQFLSSAKLEKHNVLKHEDKGRGFVKGKTCISCKKTFISHKRALKHAKYHWQTFTCEFCGKIYHHKNSFYSHLKCHHEEAEIVQCEHCNYRGKKKYFKRHIALKHTKLTPSICDVCGKTFTCEALMKSHRATVHGEIMNCKFCDFKMYWIVLKRHMRVKHYVGVKKDCHICDFNAMDSKTFLEHLEKEHSLVDQKLDINYTKCRFCPKVINKAFAEKHTLKFCKKTGGVICEICGKGFVSVRKKNTHIHLDHQLESKKKIHSCETCGKVFSNNRIKKRHINNIHLGIPRQEKKVKKIF